MFFPDILPELRQKFVYCRFAHTAFAGFKRSHALSTTSSPNFSEISLLDICGIICGLYYKVLLLSNLTSWLKVRHVYFHVICCMERLASESMQTAGGGAEQLTHLNLCKINTTLQVLIILVRLKNVDK